MSLFDGRGTRFEHLCGLFIIFFLNLTFLHSSTYINTVFSCFIRYRERQQDQLTVGEAACDTSCPLWFLYSRAAVVRWALSCRLIHCFIRNLTVQTGKRLWYPFLSLTLRPVIQYEADFMRHYVFIFGMFYWHLRTRKLSSVFTIP